MDPILEKVGEAGVKLLRDVMRLQTLGKLQRIDNPSNQQIENLRKMLLAMVADVRAVIIILAERLWQLRQAKALPSEEQQKLAQETFAVYAPLANRLGIWQIKWETEDLCMRYLHPEQYSNIAKWLATRRVEREDYITKMINIVSSMLGAAKIKRAEVTGRVKHIYSISRKMARKNVTIEEIYDISALRICVETIDDCYAVLGLLQETWSHVLEEFDDYIALPKPNGYRSIHTVLIGPDKRYLEVQIRTHQMHQESELGVAAHWRYKEGVLQTSSYESKIALLRQVMAWQQELVDKEATPTQPAQDLFADRVYVFTPLGDIIELPQGATPLDFAYAIHSEVGHRCRGAKVNGNIVTLTHKLQTGERIEILTGKHAHPSRDWANPQYGFLKTTRARARVLHWYRVQDNLAHPHLEHEPAKKTTHHGHTAVIKHSTPLPTPTNIKITGIENLLTNAARCCKPLPGDDIIGYITRNRGISIHKRHCGNVALAIKNQHARLIEVMWGEKHTATHPVDLLIRIYDRPGLLRDITTTLATEKINVQGLHTQNRQDSPEMDIYVTIEISNTKQLDKAMSELKKISHVIDIKRR